MFSSLALCKTVKFYFRPLVPSATFDLSHDASSKADWLDTRGGASRLAYRHSNILLYCCKHLSRHILSDDCHALASLRDRTAYKLQVVGMWAKLGRVYQ